MREMIRAALVIARRDYGATVLSKTFLLFLLGPLLPIGAGILFAALGTADSGTEAPSRPHLALDLPTADAVAIRAARARLVPRLGEDALPALDSPEVARVDVAIEGSLLRPVLTGPAPALARSRGPVALLVDQARADLASGQGLPPPVVLAERPVAQVSSSADDVSGRRTTARAGQLVLMFLTMLLAGMLLSNLIEEKSNKVIEVLAAAVPVDAIFAGKLLAMLGMSLTGIAAWSAMAGAAVLAFHLPIGALPPPAVGWPMFVVLALLDFCFCFLLLGGLFLGIGAHASTVREVQTLSMPVTMSQLGVVAFATQAAAAPNATLGIAAAIFPLSSPFTMLARAAEFPQLWPHALAFAWQALWVGLILWGAARLFRRSVLRSGGRRGEAKRRRAA